MENQKSELKEIIHGCVKNDRKQQRRLHELFYGKLFAICMRYTRDEDFAQDTLQRAFIKIFDNIKKFEQKGSLEGWMKRIVVNTCIDTYRKKKKDLLFLGEDHDIENLDLENEETNVNNFPYQPKQVFEAIKQLTPAYKAVFNLYAIEEYTHKEIAEMLEISVGTSKSNYLKAKLKLKKILKDNYGEYE